MRSLIATITISTAFVLTATNVSALQRGQAHGPKVKTTAPPSTAKVTAPKPTAPKGAGPTHSTGPKPQGSPKIHATGPKTTHGGGSSVKTTHGSAAKTGHGGGGAKSPKTAPTSTAVASSKKTRTTTTKTAGGDTTLTPVQQKLQRNTNLASKLEGRLPAGTDLMLAAEGFRNLGQFVAAVNVSNNLGIPFTDLKMRMVDDGMSLGQAIKVERPNVDGAFEARRAETDATRLVESTEPSLVTSTTTTTKKNATKKPKG